jgi:hypothetical protein
MAPEGEGPALEAVSVKVSFDPTFGVVEETPLVRLTTA